MGILVPVPGLWTATVMTTPAKKMTATTKTTLAKKMTPAKKTTPTPA